MRICIAGHRGSGQEKLAQRLSSRLPEHCFVALAYEDTGDTRRELAEAGVVVLAVNLLEGPMPGTRAALEDCRRLGKRLGGFILTRVDEFDAQTTHGPHIKELVQIEARELASIYGWGDDGLPSAVVPVETEDKGELAALIRQVAGK